MRNLDVWYAHIDVAELFAQLKTETTKKQRAKASKNLAKARTRDSLHAFSKLTHEVDGRPRILGAQGRCPTNFSIRVRLQWRDAEQVCG
jgi:hypothetical protein